MPDTEPAPARPPPVVAVWPVVRRLRGDDVPVALPRRPARGVRDGRPAAAGPAGRGRLPRHVPARGGAQPGLPAGLPRGPRDAAAGGAVPDRRGGRRAAAARRRQPDLRPRADARQRPRHARRRRLGPRRRAAHEGRPHAARHLQPRHAAHHRGLLAPGRLPHPRHPARGHLLLRQGPGLALGRPPRRPGAGAFPVAPRGSHLGGYPEPVGVLLRRFAPATSHPERQS